MRNILIAAALAVGLAGPALAQAPAAPGGSPAAPPAAAANRSRDACRTEVDAKSLTGPERKTAMRTCMKAKADSCRQKAEASGVPKRSGERRDYVKTCMQEGA